VGNPRDLILQDTSKNDTVDGPPWPVVVTSGTVSRRRDLTSVYPPNLPIGRITGVDNAGTDDQEIHLRPFVDPRKVEFVQVLTKQANDNR
jgi:rod shape-determining protein MreC